MFTFHKRENISLLVQEPDTDRLSSSRIQITTLGMEEMEHRRLEIEDAKETLHHFPASSCPKYMSQL